MIIKRDYQFEWTAKWSWSGEPGSKSGQATVNASSPKLALKRILETQPPGIFAFSARLIGTGAPRAVHKFQKAHPSPPSRKMMSPPDDPGEKN